MNAARTNPPPASGHTAHDPAHNQNQERDARAAQAVVTRSQSCESATGPVYPKVRGNQRGMTMVKEDLYQQVTSEIVAELERGVAPWVRPWKTLDARFGGGPVNGHTGRGYRGVNVWLLLITAMKKGYEDSRWFTFRQAQTLGAHVKKGEKSTMVIFWKQHRIQEASATTGEQEEKKIPFLRAYAVFNAEQCEGLAPQPKAEETARELRYQHAEAIFVKHAVDVKHGGDQAFFSPILDFIQMPRFDAFESEEHYWGVKLHELTHWTGHKLRLDRDLSGRFRSEAYAAEELVAEMGSAFLCAHLGIEGHLRHPEYIGNWLKVLKDDKRAVFKASSLAQAAADFVLDRKEEELEPSEAPASADTTP
jgi:antirestriction protein ArdC